MTDAKFEPMPSVIPCLGYEDAPSAIEWLVRTFGFEKHLVAPGANGTIEHAELTFGTGMIMLGSTKHGGLFTMQGPNRLGGMNQSIYVVVDAIDAHYARARAAGAEIARDIQDEDYGGRGYTARDIEGNLWSFGSYRP